MNKDWLDIGVLEDYLDGKLDAKTMNRVEREALDDPFVAEALAGLSESPKRSLQSISLLQKQLHERVAEHKSFKKSSVITWQRLSIAAAAAVMFVAVSVMFWMKENNYQKQLAGQPKKVDVTIMPPPAQVVPPEVQAAPVIASRSADMVREKEIDKAVKAAKTNSYAARQKSRTSDPVSIASDQSDEVVVKFSKSQPKQYLVGAVFGRAENSDQANYQDSLIGKVIDQASGEPLQGATVIVLGSNLKTATDRKGMFKLSADTSIKEGKIRVDYIGFKPIELLAKVNQPVNVSMVSTPNLSLNEVVVGYSSAKKQAVTDTPRVNAALAGRISGIAVRGSGAKIRGSASRASKSQMISNPIGGWDKLWAYIQQNNNFKDEEKVGQTVELSFKIGKDGTPEDLKILKAVDQKYEQEAIRLILNGPKWEKPVKANSRMTFKIDF